MTTRFRGILSRLLPLLLAAIFLSPSTRAAGDYTGAFAHPNIPVPKLVELEPPIGTLIRANQIALSDAFNFTGTNTFTGANTFSGNLLATGGRPWIDVTGAPYNADPTGASDSSTAIQNAHNACAAFAVGPCAVFFPYGTYKINTALTWSPYVPAVALSRVILQTNLSTGNFISISDQYGKPTPDPNSTGLTRSKTFWGNFQIQNTLGSGSNTAFAFFIGGATSANFATELALDGISVTGFGSGVFKLGYNVFLLHITNFEGNFNAGSYFSILAGATGTGESITVDNSALSGSISPVSTTFLLSWNTGNASDFHFWGCSFDYLGGVNDPAQTAALTSVNMANAHFEWNETANPYINLNNGIAFKIVNAKFFTPLTVGFASPFVGKVAGSSVLNVTNARYESGGTISLLYDNASAAAGNLLTLDPFLNSTSPAPTTYFTRTGGTGANTAFNAVPSNSPTAYDMSAFTVGLGTTYLGGSPGSLNVAQFIANSSTVAGVAGTNYTLFRSGVAAEESHSATGDLGLAGTVHAAGFYNPTNLFISSTAPTITAAGCGGAAASIVVSNGTAAFKINVGTTPTSACTITMPTATTGWNCFATDITTNSTSVFLQKQTGAESTTSVTITNFNDVAVATAFTASDILKVTCSAD